MKISYLANARMPGEWAHSYQIAKMCEAFADNGHEVELIVPTLKNRIKADPFDHYKIKRNFSIKKIFCLDVFSYRENASPIAYFIELYSFLFSAKIISFFHPNGLIYSRIPQAAGFFNNVALEIHDLPPIFNKRLLNNLKRAKKIIVLTNYLRSRLLEQGILSEKILVAADSADEKDFEINQTKNEARSELNLPIDAKIVVYAGSFFSHSWKGVDILLEASKLLDGKCLVVLVGGNETELEKIKNLRLSNVVAISRQPREIVRLYYRAADVLVLPNKSGDENSKYFTSPLKLFEYMASGTPIVASDLPSLREILNEGNSILVSPDNPRSLADGIMFALDQSASSKEMAQKAQMAVRQNTWQNRGITISGFID